MNENTPTSWPAVICCLSAILAICFLQWLYSVALWAILQYSLFLVVYIIGPGTLAFRMMTRGSPRHWLADISFGMGIGYALLTGFFLLARVLGFLPLLYFYPFLFLSLLIPAGRRRFSQPLQNAQQLCGSDALLLGGIGLLALCMVIAKYFSLHPLPGSQEIITYHQDYPWHIAVVGEAMHRWPMRDPQFAALPLENHSFGHVAVAASTRLAHVDLPVVVFRMFHAPLVAALVLQAFFLGDVLLKSRQAGFIAAILLLVAGEAVPTRGHLFTYIMGDKLTDFSFLLGLVYCGTWIFLAAQVVTEPRFSWPLLAGLGLLAAVATGTKVPLMPVLLAGLGGTLLWISIQQRRLHPGIAIVFVVTTIIFAVILLLLISGFGDRLVGQWLSLQPRPFEHDRASNFWKLAYPHVKGIPGASLILLVLIQLGASGLRLWGALILVWRRRLWGLLPAEVLLCMTAGAGLVAGSLYRGRWGEELYFVHYATFPLAVVGAFGLVSLPMLQKDFARRFFIIGTWVIAAGMFSKATMSFASSARWVLSRGMYPAPVVLTKDAYASYRWVRDHTEEVAILATWPQDETDFLASAFTERRVVLGGWVYQPEVINGDFSGHEERRSLLQSIFRGDRFETNIVRLRETYGANYLIWDRKQWPNYPAEGPFVRPILQNSTITVYQILPPGTR